MRLQFMIVLALSCTLSFFLVYLRQGNETFLARSESSYDPSADTGLFLVSGAEDTKKSGDLFYSLFRESYEHNLEKIDSFHTKDGEIFNATVKDHRIPYSDYWFAENLGGANGPIKEVDGVNLQIHALEKYDKAFHGGQSTATKWEQQFHNETETIWYGHCNGQSAAASRHQNPGGEGFKKVLRPVGCDPTTNCVEFEPNTIRALMAEVYMNSIAHFVGGNRCEVKEPRSDDENRADPENLSACQDPDAGTFHLALTNWLGKKKQVMIGDFSRNDEVWNYPIYKYSYSYEYAGKRLNRNEALKETQSTKYQDYAFNKSAVSFVVVAMNVAYAEALKVEALVNLKPESPLEPDTKVRKLRYLLELDEHDNILGGEWLGKSKSNHPDFIWMAFEPSKPSGNRTGANPHVDAKEVFSMWAESRGFSTELTYNDPKNPNKILSAPKDGEVWGLHNPWYTLLLDGQKTGAVFLGKDIKLQILRGVSLKGDYDVEITLNGKAMTNLAFKNQEHSVSLKPLKGINNLKLKWSKNKVEQEVISYNFRFYAMR